jgi:hypothetical protein
MRATKGFPLTIPNKRVFPKLVKLLKKAFIFKQERKKRLASQSRTPLAPVNPGGACINFLFIEYSKVFFTLLFTLLPP